MVPQEYGMRLDMRYACYAATQEIYGKLHGRRMEANWRPQATPRPEFGSRGLAGRCLSYTTMELSGVLPGHPMEPSWPARATIKRLRSGIRAPGMNYLPCAVIRRLSGVSIGRRTAKRSLLRATTRLQRFGIQPLEKNC